MFNTIQTFIKRYKKFSDNKEFTTKALRYIEWLLGEEHEIKISKHELIIAGCGIKVVLTLSKKEATFTIYKEYSTETGSYLKAKENNIIKYTETETNTYPINNNINSVNITTNELIKVYNKKGYENYKRRTTTKENYQENDIDGSRKLNEPDVMENYTEVNYYWRTKDNHVISRCIKTYKYPDGTKAFIDLRNTDETYMRFEKLDEDEKELTTGGYFYGFDKELFIKYKNDEVTTEDIKKNIYQKGYKIPPVTYF